MLNVALHRKTLEHIAAHPEEHDQHTWIERTDCGTTMCYAGTALALEGYKFKFELNDLGVSVPSGEVCDPQTGAVYEIGDQAAVILGLTDKQANTLFYNMGGLPELYAIVNKLTDGEIEIPFEMQTSSYSD
jgi:hypothetical protein